MQLFLVLALVQLCQGVVFFTYKENYSTRGTRVVYRPDGGIQDYELRRCIVFYSGYSTNTSTVDFTAYDQRHYMDYSPKGKYFYMDDRHMTLTPNRWVHYQISAYKSDGTRDCLPSDWYSLVKQEPISFFFVPPVEKIRYCRLDTASYSSSIIPCSQVLAGTSNGTLHGGQFTSTTVQPECMKLLCKKFFLSVLITIPILVAILLLLALAGRKLREAKKRNRRNEDMETSQPTPLSSQSYLTATGHCNTSVVVDVPPPDYKELEIVDDPPPYQLYDNHFN
ncbi:uncharacterized protein [Watersipora subatra]|uniref:uncharacterized protein n=1 Tax=Watersipora subatra TaxID=2589382 RepID=UPI00355BD267